MAQKRPTPLSFLWETFRALLPVLAIDVVGTLLVYFLLAHLLRTSTVWPVLGASMLPLVSNVVNFARRRTFDIVGLIVLAGVVAGLIPAAFGGSPRLLLVRESFVTGALGVVLIASVFVMRRPIMYYVIRELLTANDTLPQEHFNLLWRRKRFRRETRFVTLGWGLLLIGELVLRGYMALTMNVALVLSVAPIILTTLMLIAGAGTAIWRGRAVARALEGASDR
jgi:small-conductance mechanosensitive channel